MTDAEAIEALNDFIDNPDAHDREEQRGAARSALLVLRKSLHNAQNRAEMVCHQEPCGDCPGCARADDLGGGGTPWPTGPGWTTDPFASLSPTSPAVTTSRLPAPSPEGRG